jgi:hypothetical protein
MPSRWIRQTYITERLNQYKCCQSAAIFPLSNYKAFKCPNNSSLLTSVLASCSFSLCPLLNPPFISFRSFKHFYLRIFCSTLLYRISFLYCLFFLCPVPLFSLKILISSCFPFSCVLFVSSLILSCYSSCPSVLFPITFFLFSFSYHLFQFLSYFTSLSL